MAKKTEPVVKVCPFCGYTFQQEKDETTHCYKCHTVLPKGTGIPQHVKPCSYDNNGGDKAVACDLDYQGGGDL